ncbi:hypothetical protein UFOVP685_15 [uncultured Caudovirales phage]|uniref:Uncharacterized protein n=1 Tax=uncultured Caudovirales phage TaxID=2100421 RepID=A0A6J5MWH8_9CAUD|nr:hypothetical protein UFOVP590_8 [uncultured Caudovirales phage]CAB4157297.1 hypothetical protein UFOVP685_15 [uncultured Caudovirales phage]CAB5225490.1 hypothetical protein UFOVP750_37 [uncultured Caudovirales phage]
MKGTPAIYLGRIVDKKNFRAFIHAPDGSRRIAESWDEFEANMQSGLWFATPEDAKLSLEASNTKPKARPQRAKKEVPVIKCDLKDDCGDDEEQKSAPADDLAFEVTDDFLPKG